MYLSTALKKNKKSVKDIYIYSYEATAIIDGELPDELYEFTELESLYISHDVKAISPKIDQLKKLRSLTIRGNSLLTRLPKEIRNAA